MKKILFIDDDKDMLQLYELALTGEGFAVVTADNGPDGITKIKSNKPDLILLDVMMPNMNGIDVLKKLKDGSTTKAIPVVMFSNFSDETYIKEALSHGAAKYMVKTDYEPDDLVKELNQIMEAHKT